MCIFRKNLEKFMIYKILKNKISLLKNRGKIVKHNLFFRNKNKENLVKF